MKLDQLQPEFVDFIPKSLQPGTLYISERYMTASHLCACGCGEKVVTPLSPVDWQLRKGRGTVSLHPSIGNWNYACRSHYWIRHNKVVWAGAMTEQQIALVQARDLADKKKYIDQVNLQREQAVQNDEARAAQPGTWVRRAWRAVRRLFGGG
ncbi:MAG: hypothetical protein H6932_14825 [Burkholderiaceae bacterium]|nr:hypothetical protein [Burkholderiaceae bacterium]